MAHSPERFATAKKRNGTVAYSGADKKIAGRAQIGETLPCSTLPPGFVGL
jgi:hypothetical protein